MSFFRELMQSRVSPVLHSDFGETVIWGFLSRQRKRKAGT